ncbi:MULTISPECIES: ABC transporter ATP-binding protein [Nostoc]|uniref:ABC transporter ATP-binding protein n=1 Tax=Nostoc paludosum FACHB-159 TaxID=2692908 RepID=A0ABR8K512_9NOSO|nr:MULTISPECIES: ABC transporter ATP-binding protein [Nostoc]MBD2678517.1 ABC transporter ATP-binding protein [Nostoc sp. FACHB-857]MBD2734563.1 ABC transporter ATP-binding protein [Nostoc paludosum FACHB-159]MDZ8108961.1 ABC transporter ATP-binding protein [Nostoc sp. DedQUE12a]
MTAAVLLENVYKYYNKIPVVNDLSFQIEAGEIFALLGPNGAGKSTTIRMLTTLTKPSQGRVEVNGYDVVSQPMLAKQSIGVVLQQVSVDNDLTVWENMELHGRLHHISNPQRQQLINQWLEYVELTEKRNDLVKTLSGGMKRRLQIARALLHQPQMLFLDEPTVGLDPQTRRRLWEIIRDLNKQGMTMLLTTHYMDEVEFLCDAFGSAKPGRIGIMDGGKLISLGTLKQLRSTHGEGLVMKQLGLSEVGSDSALAWEYLFFPSLEEANIYLNEQPDKTGMMVRPSNLEDIFVELTGRQLD